MEELDLMPNHLDLYVAIMTGKPAEKAFISIGYRGMISDEPKRRDRLDELDAAGEVAREAGL